MFALFLVPRQAPFLSPLESRAAIRFQVIRRASVHHRLTSSGVRGLPLFPKRPSSAGQQAHFEQFLLAKKNAKNAIQMGIKPANRIRRAAAGDLFQSAKGFSAVSLGWRS